MASVNMAAKARYYFSLGDWEHRELWAAADFVWEALIALKEYIDQQLRPQLAGEVMPGAFVGEQVYLAAGAVVESGAMVKGPAIIGPGTVIRHGAYVREYCLVGANCVIGHASEVKHSIMLDGSQAPHFNYVGDSVLGRGVNLGAGTKLSNFKNDAGLIIAEVEGTRVPTGLNKLGAVIGDQVATGCNVVTSPGVLIGPKSLIYANALVRGFVPANSIFKLRPTTEIVPRR